MKDLTINKLFVPYEESLELKELGFDEPNENYPDTESAKDYYSRIYNT